MSSIEYANILVERRGPVGIVTLNRPQALNALNAALIADLGAALDDLEGDSAIAAIILTGSERAFAAGADIKEMADKTYMQAYREDFITSGWERVAQCRKPVIAAVAGFALGGGCEIAMMCDILIAAENARFGQPEINLGTMPGAGGTQRLPRFIGKAKAMDLCLTGRMMDAAEAERAGLVSRVVPADKLMAEALAVANRIAELVATGRDDRQGIGQPRLRDDARRGRPLRAPASFDLRHRGPEGGDGGLYRQEETRLPQPIGDIRR